MRPSPKTLWLAFGLAALIVQAAVADARAERIRVAQMRDAAEIKALVTWVAVRGDSPR
jgi:hypothetical protein